jgi:hypothetical protein
VTNELTIVHHTDGIPAAKRGLHHFEIGGVAGGVTIQHCRDRPSAWRRLAIIESWQPDADRIGTLEDPVARSDKDIRTLMPASSTALTAFAVQKSNRPGKRRERCTVRSTFGPRPLPVA